MWPTRGSIRASGWAEDVPMSTALNAAAVALEPDLGVVAAPTFWSRVWRNQAVVIGFGLLLVMIAIALLAPWIAPYDPYAQDLARRNVPPWWYAGGNLMHALGTDPLG